MGGAGRNGSLTFRPNIGSAEPRGKPGAQPRWLKIAPKPKGLGNGVHPVLRSMVEAVALRARLAAIPAASARGLRSAGRAMAPLLVLFAAELHATLSRLFAYGCALGALAFVAAEFVTLPGSAVVAQPAPQQDWITVARPIPAFALSLPEFSEAPQYAIQRHASGVGRKDILTFGDDEGATAAIEIHRPGAEADSDETASIPELRLSPKPPSPNAIETKFGMVLLDEFTEGARRCLRFTRGFDEPRLIISGRFCNAGLELVDRGLVACALDRLTLLSAASDPKIGTLFARAELKRSFCGQKSVFVAATPKRLD
jgi:hypothetical protein